MSAVQSGETFFVLMDCAILHLWHVLFLFSSLIAMHHHLAIRLSL